MHSPEAATPESLKREFSGVSIQRNARNVRNAMNATDGTDATTDEASDRPFDTPSFIINIKLLGVCFLNVALIVIYYCSFALFVAED